MFVLRVLGSSCSVQLYTESMPPNKRMKISDSRCEEERKVISRSEDDCEKDFGADWREKCRDVRAIYNYAMKKSVLTDVTFVVGEESFVCHAHRLILALGSPVFEAMFYGALAEKGDSITIPDVDPEGFRNLLRFLYSDDIFFRNDVIAFKTYFAADKYCVTHLKERCEKYLCNCELVPSNVWVFLESSLYLNSQAIKDRCFSFLQYGTETALQHSSFLDVSPKTIETLLCLDSLNVTEMKLLLNLVFWAEHKSNGEDSSFRDVLTPLLRFVRFGALTAAEFIGFLETQKLRELLTDRDALHILKHIIQPLTCSLPDWCCAKTWRDDVRVERGCEHRSGSCSCDKSKRALGKRPKSKPKVRFVASTSSSSASSSSSSSSSSSDSDEHEYY